jgi:molybdopterin-guanine dinucleotide biosynthesis protein A
VSRVAAVILAGGRAERLGGINKALIEIGGRSLLDRARDAVAECEPVLLAVGPNGFTADGMTAIPDLAADYAGPLAGIAAAVEALRDSDVEWLFSLAVDTPFFPADFVASALPLGAAADVVIGCFGPQDYPTNALWRLAAIGDLPQAVRDGIAAHSLKRLAASLKSVRLDYARTSPDDPFRNANTPEDLAFLRGRAR